MPPGNEVSLLPAENHTPWLSGQVVWTCTRTAVRQPFFPTGQFEQGKGRRQDTRLFCRSAEMPDRKREISGQHICLVVKITGILVVFCRDF